MAAEGSNGTPRCLFLHGFNGAAADWLRKGRCGRVFTAKFRRFNGAAADWLRKDVGGIFEIGSTGGFNGAAADWLRKVPASDSLTQIGTGFNGAAADWLRKDRRMIKQNLFQRSFNGAAADWLRKGAWHLLNVHLSPASMGPQPIGCGRCVAPIDAIAPPALQWGRSRLAAEGWWSR